MLQFFKNLMSSKDNTEELIQLVNGNAFLVDVRTPDEFKSGHVKGSVNIPLNTISNNKSKFENKSHIIVFCRSGMRSSNAKSLLENMGFTNVINGGTWTKINQLKK